MGHLTLHYHGMAVFCDPLAFVGTSGERVGFSVFCCFPLTTSLPPWFVSVVSCCVSGRVDSNPGGQSQHVDVHVLVFCLPSACVGQPFIYDRGDRDKGRQSLSNNHCMEVICHGFVHLLEPHAWWLPLGLLI